MMDKQPKFTNPRTVKKVVPPSFDLSLAELGLWRSSSGSGVLGSSGVPHVRGEASSEYCGDKIESKLAVRWVTR
jgi:hypothetical protein